MHTQIDYIDYIDYIRPSLSLSLCIVCIVCMCLMNKISIASVLYQVSSVSHDIFSTYVPLHPLQTKTLDMFGVQDVSIKRFLLAWESKTGVFDSGCQNRLTSHELYASERRTPFPRSAFLFLALKSFWIWQIFVLLIFVPFRTTCGTLRWGFWAASSNSGEKRLMFGNPASKCWRLHEVTELLCPLSPILKTQAVRKERLKKPQPRVLHRIHGVSA